MRSKLIRGLFIAASALALGACDGDASVIGEDSGGGGGGGGGGTGPTVASVTLLASSPQLSSNAFQTANGVTLTAFVKDSNQNVMKGQTVVFSIQPQDPGVNLTVRGGGVTDDSGTATAVLTIGNNQQNRQVTVRATSGTAFGTVTISILGTTLTISGPNSTQFNTAATYVATLADAGGVGIAGQGITFSSAGGPFNPSTPITTNSSGQATASFTPTTASASTSIQAAAYSGSLTATKTISVSQDTFVFTLPAGNVEIPLGSNQTVTVRWMSGGSPVVGATVNFDTTLGTFSGPSAVTDAAGDATVTVSSTQAGFAILTASSSTGSRPSATLTVEFVATAPDDISVQADRATIGTNQRATITAVVRDAANNLVKNQTVLFKREQDNTGGNLSAGSAVTDSQGRARVIYTASSTPSSANGVVISATVQGTSVSRTTALTVGGAALHITLGTGNKLVAEGPTSGATRYVYPYTVTVRDSAGNPAPSAQVSLSIHPMTYRKGISQFIGGRWVRTDGSGNPPIECINEDLLTGDPVFDLNGIIDSGEDLNGDGILQPGGAGVSVPATVTLNANGIADFEIRYPQNQAFWARVRLRAVAQVAGGASVEQVDFDLAGLAGDFTSQGVAPPGFESPYGMLQDCAHEQVAAFTKAAQGVAPSTTASAAITSTAPAGLNPITIPFTVSGSAAGGGTDYTQLTASPVTIPAGGSTAKIDFAVAAAPTVGSTVIVTLGTPQSQAVLGSPSVHTIVLNGAAVNFAQSSESVSQTTDPNPTLIAVTLDRAVGATVAVPFTVSGTAASTDYTLNPTSAVSIPAGQTSATISITPKNTAATTTKTVVLTLGTPSAGPAELGGTTVNTLFITP